MKKTICTHDGRFHCDQVLACVLLRKFTQQFKDADVVRSRDPNVWASSDIVVDVGGKYEPPKLLDHHQIQFQDTFPGRNIRLSSAGLVYLHFPQIIPNAVKRILENQKLPFQPASGPEVINQIRQKIYDNLVVFVDANDNGIQMVKQKQVNSIPTTIWARVAKTNPMWWDESPQMPFFNKALQIVEEQFISQVRQVLLGSIQTTNIVRQAFSKRYQIHQSGAIVCLQKYVPWQKSIINVEADMNQQQKTLFMVFPQKSGLKWRIQAISKKQGSFQLRKGLRSDWRGIKDMQRLRELSKIEDIDFVHASGFIGGAVSKQSTILMGIKSMQN